MFIIRKPLILLLVTVSIGVLTFSTTAAALRDLQVGDEAPDFNLSSLFGERHDLASLHGEKMTVILFWATWGRNSEAALKRMKSIYDRYRDQGLSVIAINVDGQQSLSAYRAAISETTQRLQLDYPLLVDDRLRTFHDYGVIAVPTTVILNPDRIISYAMPGYPLIGVEEMLDYIAATIEGRGTTSQVAREGGYQANSKALHYFNLGRQTLKSRRMAQTAEIWFKKAIAADAGFIEPRLSLGRFFLARHEPGKAAEQFAEVLDQAPDNVVALCETAMLLARDGMERQAEELFSRGMRNDEYYAPCYYYLGYLKGRKGAIGEAMHLFDQALEMNRNSSEAYIYMGKMYEERQDSEQSAASYRKALDILLGI